MPFLSDMQTLTAATENPFVVLKPSGGQDSMPERLWKQLHRYWLSKHVDGRVPSRSDIDPILEIPQLVKNLILLDARADFTYRLVGSEVVERHGMDMTGQRSGSSGRNPKAIAEWQAAIEHVSMELKPRLLVSRIGNSDIAQNVMILLPLADGDGRIEMVLVGSFYNEHFKRGTDVHDMEAREVVVGP
jgi:hypothetical protein